MSGFYLYFNMDKIVAAMADKLPMVKQPPLMLSTSRKLQIVAGKRIALGMIKGDSKSVRQTHLVVCSENEWSPW
jgi:hypothetical protein